MIYILGSAVLGIACAVAIWGYRRGDGKFHW